MDGLSLEIFFAIERLPIHPLLNIYIDIDIDISLTLNYDFITH